VPAEYADFVKELESELAAADPADPTEEAMAPQRWPWTGAAAVLGSFRPRDLRPLPDRAVDGSALVALSDVVFTSTDGSWVLVEPVRSRALQRLASEGSLREAVEANATLDDAHRDWLRRLVVGEPLGSLASLETNDLDVLDTVARWVEPLGLPMPVRRAEIYAVKERRSLIDPLRKLVGTHFRGRVDELARIDRHVRGGGDRSAMVISGPGGSGKSSLLGKVLLELEERVTQQPVSFAYVDFDKARHNPRNPQRLVEQIVRQLRLLHAANAETGREFAGLEAISAGTDVDLATEVLELDRNAVTLDDQGPVNQVAIDGLISAVAAAIERVPRPYPTPLLLVFDTVEEVQLQGPGAVQDVRDLVAKFENALPGLRLIVSGRGNLGELVDNDPDSIVKLGDLDDASAAAVLESLGVASPEISRLVYQRFGGNPLTLHLAAEALARMGTAAEAFQGALAQANALAAVGMEQIQGMLYDRILGHLGDPEVVKVAQPGLAVRRVDVDVIREVLSVPCELDPDRADTIFERLRREVSMFELDDDGSLRHRQDVRRLMLRTMTDDPRIGPQVADIHRRAVAFYAEREGDKARAEEVYHRLMTGQDPRSFQDVWKPELRQSLFSALEDPLSEQAKLWLRRRLGLVAADDERATWEDEDWEVDAAARARSWLASADPARVADVLAERTQRLPGSPLFALDVAVRIDLDRLDEAEAVLDEGIRSCIEARASNTQLELAEQAIRLATHRKDAAGVVAATEAAVTLADSNDEKVRGLTEMAGSVDTLEQLGATDEASRLADSVARRFNLLSPDVLRDNPGLVRTVVETVGSTDSSVLAQAAVSLGDVTSEAVFRDDAFALSRVLESTVPEARAAMNALALEVGLAEDRWTPLELAASAVERGRTGKAVVVALDYAAEESTTRQMIVDSLVRPVRA
jgi:Cdc6-like AAA superfamily ATPase